MRRDGTTLMTATFPLLAKKRSRPQLLICCFIKESKFDSEQQSSTSPLLEVATTLDFAVSASFQRLQGSLVSHGLSINQAKQRGKKEIE